ncbi:hypothetical protein RFI_04056, partial [Reticulomyxa filosa]
MILIGMEEEIKTNSKKEVFSVSSCFSKEWVSLTNKPQKLNTLICCLCDQIANNAMELHCNEHENADQAYLVGEECLQKYLKLNNEKCPVGQHDHCKFSKNKVARQQISELIVICPREYDLGHVQSNEGRENENGTNCELKNNCNYKGKIKEMKEHLNKSCQLISTKQNSPRIQSQLETMNSEIEKLQHMVKELQAQLQDKQIDYLKHEALKKEQQIIALTSDIQQLKNEMTQFKKQQIEHLAQYQIKLEEFVKRTNEEQIKQFNVNKQMDNLKLELTNNIQQLKTENGLHNIELKKQAEQLKQYQFKIDAHDNELKQHK